MFNYLFSKKSPSYDRENFDLFLKKVSFSYKVPSIHVTGSNGKGQTCSYISSIYKEAGYKVGLFTSPYCFLPMETIQINEEPIPEDVFLSYLTKYKSLFDKYNLTEFEIITFIALTYFNDEKCDIAVIECGMGGEIDATNIFNPILSIITSISLEHTSVLGRTLSEIAEHKAGIIKQDMPVLIDEFNEEIMNVIAERTYETDSKIITLGKYHNITLTNDGYRFDYDIYEDLFIKRKSLASVKDATFAIEAISILKNTFNVTDENIKSGLYYNIIHGRLETFENYPNIYVDGAHNPEAIFCLVKDMENIIGSKNIHILFACFKDKNINSMLPNLAILTDDITLTEFENERCRKEEDYFLYLDEYKFNSDYKSYIQNFIKENPDDILLITGSLAFATLVSSLIRNGEFKNE